MVPVYQQVASTLRAARVRVVASDTRNPLNPQISTPSASSAQDVPLPRLIYFARGGVRFVTYNETTAALTELVIYRWLFDLTWPRVTAMADVFRLSTLGGFVFFRSK